MFGSIADTILQLNTFFVFGKTDHYEADQSFAGNIRRIDNHRPASGDTMVALSSRGENLKTERKNSAWDFQTQVNEFSRKRSEGSTRICKSSENLYLTADTAAPFAFDLHIFRILLTFSPGRPACAVVVFVLTIVVIVVTAATALTAIGFHPGIIPAISTESTLRPGPATAVFVRARVVVIISCSRIANCTRNSADDLRRILSFTVFIFQSDPPVALELAIPASHERSDSRVGVHVRIILGGSAQGEVVPELMSHHVGTFVAARTGVEHCIDSDISCVSARARNSICARQSAAPLAISNKYASPFTRTIEDRLVSCHVDAPARIVAGDLLNVCPFAGVVSRAHPA